MEKCLILGPGQGKYKSLEHLVVAESKKLMKGKEKKKKGVGLCGKDTRVNLKESQWPKLQQFEKQS